MSHQVHAGMEDFSPAQTSITTKLDELLKLWESAAQEPDQAGVLSTYEYAALAIAAKSEMNFRHSPLEYFLYMDPWLQRWVMERRGWGHLVGKALG